MPWNIAQAKQRFSEIVRRAAERSLGDELRELRQIMREEQYEFPQLHRSTRRNQFVHSLEEK